MWRERASDRSVGVVVVSVDPSFSRASPNHSVFALFFSSFIEWESSRLAESNEQQLLQNRLPSPLLVLLPLVFLLSLSPECICKVPVSPALGVDAHIARLMIGVHQCLLSTTDSEYGCIIEGCCTSVITMWGLVGTTSHCIFVQHRQSMLVARCSLDAMDFPQKLPNDVMNRAPARWGRP